MFYDLLDAVRAGFKNNKRLWLVLLLPLIAIVLYLSYAIYFSKGTLSLNVSGPEGSSRSFISSLSDPNFKEVPLVGREVSARLKPGAYRVSSVIYSSTGGNQNEAVNELSKLKVVEVRARQTAKVDLKLQPFLESSSTSTPDKTALLTTSGDKIFATSIYGVSKVFNLSLQEQYTIRKEPGFLRRIAGICNFKNGASVAVDSNGKYYYVAAQEATELDVSSVFNLDELSYLEYKPTNFINNTPTFVCKDSQVNVMGIFSVSDNGVIARTSKLPDKTNGYKNAITDNFGGTLFYDSVSSDSFEYGSDNNGFKKRFTYLNSEGSAYLVNSPTYITGISIISEKGDYCYFYKKDIYCATSFNSAAEKIPNLPTEREIVGLIVLEKNKFIYSDGLAVWLYDRSNQESTKLYSSKQTINTGTLNYDKNNQLILFAGTLNSSDSGSNTITKLSL